MVKLVSEKPPGGVNYILDTWSTIRSSNEDNHLYISTPDAKSILFNREIFCFLSPFLSSLIKGTFHGSCCLANYFDTTIILPDVSSKTVYDLKSLMIKGTISGLSGHDAKELKSLYSFLGFESMIMKEEVDDEITVEHEYRIEDDRTDGDGGYDDYNEGDEANKDDEFLKTDSRGVDVNDGTVMMTGVDLPISTNSEENDDYTDISDRENITNSHEEFEENEDLSSTENNEKSTLDLNANDKRVEKMADEDVYIPSSSKEKDNDADMSGPSSNSMVPSPDGMTPSPGQHGPGVPHGPTSNSLAPKERYTENRKTKPDIIGHAEDPTLATNKVMENASVMDEDLNEGGGVDGEEGNLTQTSSENRHAAKSSEITEDYRNLNMNCFVKLKKFKNLEGELNELDETNVKETIPSYEVRDMNSRRLMLRKIPGTSNTISSTDPDNEGESNRIKSRLKKKKDSVYKKKRDSDDYDFDVSFNSDDSDFDFENIRPAQKRKMSGRSQGPVSYKDMFSSDDF